MRRWLVCQAISSTDSSQWWMQPHGLYSRHENPSTSHHCSVTFTGYGCPSGFSLNSLCLPSVMCKVWLRQCLCHSILQRPYSHSALPSLHVSCTVWQTSTHDDDWGLRPHLCSTYHRGVMLPLATMPLASPLCVSGTLCLPTSRNHHHCLSSSDMRDIVINYLTSVKCSRSCFFNCTALKNTL